MKRQPEPQPRRVDANARRLILAFAIAIALHEVIAALIPARQRESSRPEMVSHVTIARIVPKPSPKPTPTPARTPLPVTPKAHVIAPVAAKVVAPIAAGQNARKETVHRIAAARPKPPPMHNTKPLWDIPVGGQGAGAGNRSGAGSVGNGSGAGSGSGEGGNGSGSGGGSQPCGDVTFANDPAGSRYDQQTGGYYETIQMSVHFPDGRSDTVMLDYPWYYRNAQSDPWSPRNVDNPNFIAPFQFPPASLRSDEAPLVRYVMSHTRSDGYTSLKPCPNAAR